MTSVLRVSESPCANVVPLPPYPPLSSVPDSPSPTASSSNRDHPRRNSHQVLGLHVLPSAAARSDGGDPRRPRLGRRAAHRRRQVAVLPGAGAGPRAGSALVISPLISLMKDQVDTLVQNGVDAACYNSSLASDRKASVAAGIREGRYSLLYVSPGAARRGGQRELPQDGRPRVLYRDRRGALHQPVGPRLPPGVPADWRAALAVSRRQPARVHRDGDRAGPARHRVPAGAPRRRRARRLLRSSQPRLPRPAARHAEEAAAGDPRAPPRERGHHLLHVAPRRWTRWPSGCRPRASARCRITRGSTTWTATATRTPSSTKTPTSWWRPSRSGWASIARTCAS